MFESLNGYALIVILLVFIIVNIVGVSLFCMFVFQFKKFAEYALTRFIYLIFSDRK